MAKKKTNDNFDNFNTDNEEKPGNKIVSILIALVIVFLWLAFFAVLIRIDVGGFGSNVLRPVLKDVPIINKILPKATDSQLIDENDYAYGSLAEAIARIKELELQLDSATDTSTANSEYSADLEAEIARLKTFEENQLEYEKKLLEFETNVVFNDKAPDIEEYKAYYESINPENAEELYRQVVEQIQYNKKIIEMGERYSKMDPVAAANILEVMTGDLDLVADILNSMKTAQSSLIMAEMTPEFSAKITKKMSILE